MAIPAGTRLGGFEVSSYVRVVQRCEDSTRGRTSPDGEKIAYLSATGIVWHAADGSGPAERLVPLGLEPNSWSPDGKLLSFTDSDPKTRADLWVLSIEGERRVRPVLQTPAAEAGGRFSPDGRWIAYDSNESGRMEVFVQPFPGPGGKSQVSTEGGSQPVWARNGREIFYRSGDKMMTVEVDPKASLRLSKPEVLFEGRYDGAARWFGYAAYDVTADGQRFLMVRDAAPTRIRVVLDWAKELEK